MTSVSPETFVDTELLKAQAYGLGFDLVGVTSLGPMDTATHFDEWVSAGYAGEMAYLERGAIKRRDSRLPFANAASAIVVGLSYGGREPSGTVARYARGDDYHDLMAARLDDLHEWIEQHVGREIRGKAYVDTGPILERDLARRAGLGWFGKNTNLVNPRIGSFFFIGALLVDLELPSDEPFEADRCGTCTRCLDACPTAAFVEPRVLDSTKCISYLTIESRSAVPEEMRPAIGSLIYGCDICQDVCPWNVRFATELRENAFEPRAVVSGDPRAVARKLLNLDETTFQNELRGSPMKRAKRRGLARNAATVLGNIGTDEDIACLSRAADDPDPLVSEHAEWALRRIRTRADGQSARSTSAVR